MVRNVLMIGASSDIGADLASRFLENGDRLIGTFRTNSDNVESLRSRGATFFHLDVLRENQLPSEILEVLSRHPWDVLFLNPGTMLPIGPFQQCSWDDWERCVRVNALSLLRVLHQVFPFRDRDTEPLVVAWGGPGTNGAAAGFSAISSSKILLIKMFEILAEEVGDTRFTVVGPGWVETKIHDELLRNGDLAGSSRERTRQRLDGGKFTSFSTIWDFIEWAWMAPGEVLSGRNFSIPGDDWSSDDLAVHLIENPDAFKLRRYHNSGHKKVTDGEFSPPQY